MWIRNIPDDYQNQLSFHDNLIFLWKSDNVYVMDNHLAAAWCWMQECDADTRYNFMHIDRHNDLGTNTPFDVYRHIKDNQHLAIDEYTDLSWENEGNYIQVKAFRWDNYITQCAYLFPEWFQETVFSTRTPLGRSECEKLYILNGTKGTDLYHVLKILYFAEQKHLAKWGTRMTRDCYRTWDYGPVTDGVYHAIKNNRTYDSDFVDMFNNVADFAGDDAPNVILPKRYHLVPCCIFLYR